jgi:hypothetical protein
MNPRICFIARPKQKTIRDNLCNSWLKILAKKVFLLVALFIHNLLLPVPAWAQAAVTAEWEADAPPESGWTVGDPIPLRLRVTHPDGIQVALPELPEQWGAFEVREQRLLEPVQDGSSLVTVRELSAVAWAPGEYETPPTTIQYQDSSGQAGEIAVQAISITVASVLAEGEQDKRDLKPQAELARPPIWPWLLGGVLAAALLAYLAWRGWRWWQRKRRAGAGQESQAVDSRPPEEIAYETLDRIAALDLPAQAEFKQHYTLVSDCLRLYLEGIYPISALDRTTTELVTALRQTRIDSQAITALRQLLDEADLVKFAKLCPPLPQARAAVDHARTIVDVTRPQRSVTNEGVNEQP